MSDLEGRFGSDFPRGVMLSGVHWQQVEVEGLGGRFTRVRTNAGSRFKLKDTLKDLRGLRIGRMLKLVNLWIREDDVHKKI